MKSVLNENGTRLGLAVACVGFGMINGIALAGDDECVTFDDLGSVDIFQSIFDQAIELDDSLLYLSTGNREAQVFDITDVAQPILLGGLGVGDHFRVVTGISVQEGIAYLSTAVAGGFYIIDVSDPTSPVTLSQIDELFTFNVTAVGNLIYTAGHFTNAPDAPTSLFIIDASDPSSPTILSSTEFAADFVWNSNAVAVEGNTVYMAGGDGGLIIMDASDPSAPVVTGSFASFDSTLDVQVVGTTAYIADGTGGLKVVDISDPGSIVLLGEYPTAGTMVRVQVLDNICYATVREGGVFAFDVSDPNAITLVGAVPVINPWMTDLAIQDGVMFTAEANLLRVFSVDDQCDASCDSVADMNNDGVLNFFDISAFLSAYAAGDPIADLARDGLFDFHDISVFIGAYLAGCP